MKYSFLFFAILFSHSILSQIIHVPEDHNSIQDAINASQTGDSILLENGFYAENLIIQHPLVLMSAYAINQNEDHIQNTVIDGDSLSSVIFINNVLSADVKIIGLTIQNGCGQQTSEDGEFSTFHGGGLFIANSFGVVVENSIITENYISGMHNAGGGVYCVNTPFKITDCLISENTVSGGSFIGDGGGVYVENSDTEIINCTISDNVSLFGYGKGCAVYCQNSEIFIQNSEIRDNIGRHAAGIYIADGELLIEHTDIIGNISSGNGSALASNIFLGTIQVSVLNCNIEDNHAGNGGAISVSNTDFYIENTNFIHNSGGYDHGALHGAQSSIEIMNSTFEDNYVGGSFGASGGAIDVYNCVIDVYDSTFDGNYTTFESVTGSGGAFSATSSICSFQNVLMINNESHGGGAIFLNNSDLSLFKVLMYDNLGVESGGAIYSALSHVNIQKSTIADNSSPKGAGYYARNDTLLITNSILWNPEGAEYEVHEFMDESSVADMVYSNIRGGEEDMVNLAQTTLVLDGIVDVDPMFVNPLEGDYELEEDSPMVNAGVSFYELNSSVIVDMSAEEFLGEAPDMGYFEADFIDFLAEKGTTELKVFPNPTTGVINLPTSTDYSNIEIYNIEGRLVDVKTYGLSLSLEYLEPGVYTVVFVAYDKQIVSQPVKLVKL